jgi:hypothetical protein
MPESPPVFGFCHDECVWEPDVHQSIAIVTPPGETNRLFVVEQDGWIAVVTNLANPTRPES